MKALGYLGPPGTFSEKAARLYAARSGRPDALLCPYPSVPEVFLAAVRGEVDGAVVPVENSLEGAVNITLDLLGQQEELGIIAEVIVSVRHYLLARPGTHPGEVGVLVTHPHAFAQCYTYLREHLPRAEVRLVASTGEAARIVAEGPPGWAAVAGEEAAAAYGLEVISPEIQDSPYNKTRFPVLARGGAPPSGRDKTSLVFALPEDRPGGLYAILGEFAREGINLTKIESRPAKRELGEYIFFLDCEGHASFPPLREVVARLKEKTAFLRVLGSYPCAPGVDC